MNNRDKMKTNKEEFEELVEKCFTELSNASREKYDTDKAILTAAMFLAAQMKLAFFIEDIELNARHLKNEIERIEAEKYFDAKLAAIDGKKTEGFLTQSVAKDVDVNSIKKEAVAAEAQLNKYKYLMTTLLNGHLFFRTMAKNKDWE